MFIYWFYHSFKPRLSVRQNSSFKYQIKKKLYNGINIFEVVVKYSFIISSFPHALLYFKDLMHFRISPSVIGEFKIPSLSSSEIFDISSVWSFSDLHLSLRSLKKVYNVLISILLSCF